MRRVALLLRQLSLSDARHLLTEQPDLPEEAARHVRLALRAGQAGCGACIASAGDQHGALLLELFTRDGVGTLITSDIYEVGARRPSTILAGCWY